MKKIVHKTRQWDAEWAERKVRILAFERYRKQRLLVCILRMINCWNMHRNSFRLSILVLIFSSYSRAFHSTRSTMMTESLRLVVVILLYPFISTQLQKYCVKNCKRHNIIIVQIIRRVMHRRQRRERWRDAIVSLFCTFIAPAGADALALVAVTLIAASLVVPL